MISFNNNNITFSLKKKRILKHWITSVIESKSYSVGDINYIFTSDEEILSINSKFLSHNYYTDIITFDTSSYSEPSDVPSNIVSADIFISIDTVKSNALLYKTSFNQELHRVMIHGILHLIGYDDMNYVDKEVMTLQENCALSLLTINDD